MTESPPTATSKSGFENFVDLIDVVTDWSFVVLVVLIVFRKQIGEKISDLVGEIVTLISRTSSVKAGGTELVFTPAELKNLATQNNATVLRAALLDLPTPDEAAEIDDAEPVGKTGAEREELDAYLAALTSRQDTENEA